jgi:cytochrome oxidase Cu insertion factor (SCO1/SenC/PrrC family)
MAHSEAKQARRAAARRRAGRRKRMVWGGVFALIVIGVSAVIVLNSDSGDEVAAVAPDFELTSVDGEGVSLSDYRGRPVAVTFMHSW